jgi:hypothetical protein
MYSDIGRLGRPVDWLLLSCLIAVVAYLPTLNNGFIADDYVILKRVDTLKIQPLYLLQVPPENFRFVSYIVFGAIKTLAGYRAPILYAFNIAVHVANLILLSRLLRVLVRDETTIALAVLFFGVFQAPQEAVMWLAAMNETTLFFFTLLTLVCWTQERYVLATLSYAFALFSKESGVVVPALVLMVDLYRNRFVWRHYALLLLPTAIFGCVFLFTLSNNFMLTNRSYSFGPHALIVLAVSLHRLLWPWFYIILIVVWLRTRKIPWLPLAAFIGTSLVTMLPYMFISYQNSLPSRQLYLASAVLMTMFATLVKPLRGTMLLKIVVAAFVAFNAGYLWIRKDAQFEERAAPTSQLIEALKHHAPQRTVVRNFAYPYPEIVTGAALAAGWEPGLVSMEDPKAPCPDCLRLEWNAGGRRYF